MVYVYGIVYYFYTRSKERQKKKSGLMIRAITHLRRKNYEQAQYYLEEAYLESTESDDISLAAESLYYMAFIHNENDNGSKALELLIQSLEYYQYLDESEGIHKVKELMSKCEGK